MFGLTALELARIQFGFTIAFHIVFPAISIAEVKPVLTVGYGDKHGHH